MNLKLATIICSLSIIFGCKPPDDTGFEPTAPFLIKKQVFEAPATDEDPVSSVSSGVEVKIAGNNGNGGATNFSFANLTSSGDFAVGAWKSITQTAGMSHNKCNRIQQLSGGNLLMLGTAGISMTDCEAYAVVTDAGGNYVKHYKTDNVGANEFNSAVLQSDGALLITGSSTAFGTGDPDFYLVKLDVNLDFVWEKNFGTEWNEGAVKIVPFDNNGNFFYLFGYTDADFLNGRQLWLIRINNLGDSVWSKTLGTDVDDEPRDIIRTEDENHVILSVADNDNRELQFYKIDPSTGKDNWLGTAKYGMPNQDIDAYHLINYPSSYPGGTIIAVGYGYASGTRTDEDMLVIKTTLSFDGPTVYTIGEADFNERGKTAVEVADGIMIIGYKSDKSGNTNKDLFVAKIRK